MRRYQRQRPYLFAICSLFLLSTTCFAQDAPEIAVDQTASLDVTDQLVELGNPFAARFSDPKHYYARNVWCIEVFNERLFFGHGNSSNFGPASNAGRINAGGKLGIDVWTYDPATQQFKSEERIEEEQIDRYRVVDGSLTIPGHDSTKPSWDFGSLYRRTDEGSWKAFDDVPHGVHVYDVTAHQGRWFAALGTDGKHAAIAFKQEQQNVWTPQLAPEPRPAPDALRPTRIYGFVSFGEQLLACGTPTFVPPPNLKFFGNVLSWSGNNWTIDPQAQKLVTGIGNVYSTLVRLERAIAHDDATVYLCVRGWNDHQWKPLSLVWATGFESEQIHLVPLTEGDLPYDIKRLDDQRVAVLVNRPQAEGRWRVSVIVSHDLKHWQEPFHFVAPTFARSFAMIGDEWFFGLGSETATDPQLDKKKAIEALSAATGDLLKLHRALSPVVLK